MFSLYHIYVWNIVVCLIIIVFFSKNTLFILVPFESIIPILIGMISRKDIRKISNNIPLIIFYVSSIIFSLPMFLLSVVAILEKYNMQVKILSDLSVFLMVMSLVALPTLLIISVTRIGPPKANNIRKHYFLITSLLFIHNVIVLGLSG